VCVSQRQGMMLCFGLHLARAPGVVVFRVWVKTLRDLGPCRRRRHILAPSTFLEALLQDPPPLVPQVLLGCRPVIEFPLGLQSLSSGGLLVWTWWCPLRFNRRQGSLILVHAGTSACRFFVCVVFSCGFGVRFALVCVVTVGCNS
jgi:hypothetical protein